MVEVESITALQEQIKNVARARQEAQRLVEEKAMKLKEWEADNELFLGAVKDATEYRDAQENQLRELTLAVYAETGDKKPCEGVGIRERIVLQYDGKVAFDWAKAHKIALMLDTKAFEKIAKADPPDFVKTIIEPQSTISTDLSAVLKKEVK